MRTVQATTHNNNNNARREEEKKADSSAGKVYNTTFFCFNIPSMWLLSLLSTPFNTYRNIQKRGHQYDIIGIT